jgi:hypothetical protein
VKETVYLFSRDFFLKEGAEYDCGRTGIFKLLDDIEVIAQRALPRNQWVPQSNPEIGSAEVHAAS